MEKPIEISFYWGGYIGSELKTVSADGIDYTANSQQAKNLKNLCYPDRNGFNPGFYVKVESTSCFARFRSVESFNRKN